MKLNGLCGGAPRGQENVLRSGKVVAQRQVLVDDFDAFLARVYRVMELDFLAFEPDLPAEGRKLPAMILINVDLPAPLSPISEHLAGVDLRSTSVSAWMAPNFLEIPRSSNRRTALLSIGSDDAFLQDQVAVEPALAVATTAKQLFTRS